MPEEKELGNIKDRGENQIYEIGYHLVPSVSEESVPGEASVIHGIITDLGGNIISEGMPAIKQLSFVMEKKLENKTLKFSKAYFGWIKLEIDSSLISEVSEKIKNMPNVLRFIVVKTVRENTMHVPKIPTFKKDGGKDVVDTGDVSEKTPVSEEEIDKSIDELVLS